MGPKRHCDRRCANSQRVAGREQHVRPRLSEAFSSAEWVALGVPRDEVAPGSAGQTLASTSAKVWAGAGSGPGERPGPAARAAGAALPPGGGPRRGASAPDEPATARAAGASVAVGWPVPRPARSPRRVCRSVGLWTSPAGGLPASGSRGPQTAWWVSGMPGGQGRDGWTRRGRGEAGGARGLGLSPQGGGGRRALLGRPLLWGIRGLRVISALLQATRAAGLGARARRPFQAPEGVSLPTGSAPRFPAHPHGSLQWLPHQRGGGGVQTRVRGTSEWMRMRPDATMRGSGVGKSGRLRGTSV